MIDLPTREALAPLKKRVLQGGRYFRPDTSVYEQDGQRFVVKDCRCMHPFLRGLMGRRSSRREARIYQRLQGLEGLPAFYGIIDDDAFAIEHIEGETLARAMGEERIRRALIALEKILAEMHARKVVHLDLKQKRNILVTAHDQVKVIDYQSAFYLGGWGKPFFGMLKKRDLAGLVKFKAKYVPDLLSDEEERFYKRDQVLAKLWPFTHLVRVIRKLFGGKG